MMRRWLAVTLVEWACALWPEVLARISEGVAELEARDVQDEAQKIADGK